MPDIERINGKAEARPASKRVQRGLSAVKEEDMELDLTPMMNILLILIPFLATMAVFLHLAVVEFALPPGVSSSAEADAPNPDHIDISVVVTPKGYTILGSGQKLDFVPKADGLYNFDFLVRQLKAIKYKYPQEENIVLMVDPEVRYDDVIGFMDQCRASQFPNVGLSGGFQ